MEVSGGSISFLVKIKEAETELYLKTQMLYSKSHIKMSCREFLYLKLIVPSKIEKSHGEYKIKEAETELYLKTQMLYSKSHIKMSCREFLYLKLIVPSKIEKSHGEYKK